MLTIRLQRKGKKNQPFFKIVVTEEKRSSTGGRFVEELGFYNPVTKEKSLKKERAKYWLSVGAKPSDTVYNMLVQDSVIEGKKIPKHKKSKKKQEEKPAEIPATEAPKEKQGSEPAKEQEPAPEEKPEAGAPPKEAIEEPKKEDTPST
ncbi:MAG: 30S ribosomal protein S16 [Candidatus Wildermuthbacteria bacterium RIFCSPHIGHO2_02_FULL_49_9]|uniref:Small ribosomal subunit protein bS16 n=1 Tax=Candidatus Wildermuthbacteria bacterium RIFCSPHIGHO2_02_FULL_49_9 TaxID=1802456 RepID=A0A1G2REA4_9BACT|nr:MAG: 30S ribosomal protein S16 [Candidatus Wildermuthbacteria bacterium RIFCSPHIGHO2_02_FULL_49_9]